MVIGPREPHGIFVARSWARKGNAPPVTPWAISFPRRCNCPYIGPIASRIIPATPRVHCPDVSTTTNTGEEVRHGISTTTDMDEKDTRCRGNCTAPARSTPTASYAVHCPDIPTTTNTGEEGHHGISATTDMGKEGQCTANHIVGDLNSLAVQLPLHGSRGLPHHFRHPRDVDRMRPYTIPLALARKGEQHAGEFRQGEPDG